MQCKPLLIAENAQLHYLLEERKPSSRERFLFFCSQCFCILKTSPGAGPPDAVIEALENRCPGCNAQLQASIACKSARVAEEWEGISLAVPRRHRQASEFKTALSLRGFRFGLAPLDNLVQRLEPGWLAAFTGPYADVLAELLCVRAQLPERVGGLDSTVVFVDGGNSSDPYLSSIFAKRYLMDPEVALRRVATSRAFTIYQLADLVRNELPRAIRDYGSKLAIVSDVLSMFDDPSVTEPEARRVIQAIVEGLQAATDQALVLVTMGKETKYDKIVTGAADAVVGLDPHLSGVRANLTKHPSVEPSSAVFRKRDLLAPVRHKEAFRVGKNSPLVQDSRVA
jgi:hypothetical protein